MSFILSKPLKAGNTYNQQGVFKFVMQEVTATEDDSHELGIANYYKYFPKESADDGSDAEEPDTPIEDGGNNEDVTPPNNGKKVWF